MKNTIIYFIKKPAAAAALVILIHVAGIYSFFTARQKILPGAPKLIFTVETRYQNYAASLVEKIITKPLEEKLAALPGLKNIYARSENGKSVIFLNFYPGAGYIRTQLYLYEKIASFAGNIPSDCEKPVIKNYDPEAKADFILSITAPEYDSKRLKTYCQNKLIRKLQKIPGIANVKMYGAGQTESRILIKKEYLQKTGINFKEVHQSIRDNNFFKNCGYAIFPKTEAAVLIDRDIKSTADLRQLRLKLKHTAARLADAACIKKKNKERQNVTLMNGCQNLMLYIHKNAQASLLHTGKKVSRLLSEFKKNSAKKTAAAIIPVFNRYELLQNELNRLYLSLLLGLLILIMLCLFFFRKFYLVLIVIGSISFSVLGTIAGLKLCRISLNIISITALAAASGMTADASLIMLEYLLKANRNKLHKYVQSVMTAFLPITAGILTTIIVFTPVFFLKGNFKQLFTAAAAAVVFSQGLALVYAVYILPVLYRGLNNHSPFCIKLKIPGAAAVNRQIFRYKKYIIFLATLFILIPVFLFLSRSSVINSVNTAEKKIKLRYDFKPGTRLKQMKEKAAAAGNLFKKKVSGIKNIFIKTEKYSSDIIISIKDKKSLTETSTRIKKLIKNFHLSDTDAFLHLQNKDNRLKKNQTVTIEMSGTDYKIIRQKLQQLNKRLYSLPAVKQILFNFRSDFKKIILTPDRSKLARAGVTPAAAASFLQQRGQGFIAAKFTPQSRRHSREDIRVSAEGFYFKDRKLKQVQFPGGNTRLALNSFFKRREANQLSALTRKNKNRYLGITVIGKNKITAADLKNRITRLTSTFPLPPQYFIDVKTSNNKYFNNNKQSLLLMAVLIIFLIYFITASMFNSFIKPLLLLWGTLTTIALPAAIIIYNGIADYPAMLALGISTGLAVNNMVLVMNEALQKGKNKNFSKLIKAVKYSIVLSTCSTAAALLPGLLSANYFYSRLALLLVSALLWNMLFSLYIFPGLNQLSCFRISAGSDGHL